MALGLGAALLLAPALATAETGRLSPEDLKKLLDIVARQNDQLKAQQQQLKAQNNRLKQLEKVVNSGAGAPKVRNAAAGKLGDKPRRVATTTQGGGTTVGQPEKRDRPREVSGVYEAGGVLAGPGSVVIEPSIEYSQSNINRFFFSGLEVVDTVLIGQIEATDSDRDTIVARTGFRMGFTNRMEGEVKIPYVYRSDRVTNQVISTGASSVRSLDGKGLGDIEGTLRYQLNSGREGWPIFVTAVRGKSTTGKGPFDVPRDNTGIETELPTGSGFYSVEPGLTMLFGSDPAVFFANVKYNYHIAKDVGTTVAGNTIGRVDPGDTIGLAFGMGIGLNEQTSVSIAYEHNFIGRTSTVINGIRQESNPLDVGSLAFGFSYALSPMISLNLSVQAGVTEDAPDVAMTFRVPVKFQLFDEDDFKVFGD